MRKGRRRIGAHGLSTTIADARFMKPLDVDMVLKLAREHEFCSPSRRRDRVSAPMSCRRWRSMGMLDGGLRMRSLVLPTSSSTTIRRCDVRPRRPRPKGIVAKVFEALGKDFRPKREAGLTLAIPRRKRHARGPD